MRNAPTRPSPQELAELAAVPAVRRRLGMVSPVDDYLFATGGFVAKFRYSAADSGYEGDLFVVVASPEYPAIVVVRDERGAMEAVDARWL